MNYILICDYPYHTVKTFYVSLFEAMATKPINNVFSNTNRLLNGKIYELSSYNETEHGINYTITNVKSFLCIK